MLHIQKLSNYNGGSSGAGKLLEYTSEMFRMAKNAGVKSHAACKECIKPILPTGDLCVGPCD